MSTNQIIHLNNDGCGGNVSFEPSKSVFVGFQNVNRSSHETQSNNHSAFFFSDTSSNVIDQNYLYNSGSNSLFIDIILKFVAIPSFLKNCFLINCASEFNK